MAGKGRRDKYEQRAAEARRIAQALIHEPTKKTQRVLVRKLLIALGGTMVEKDKTIIWDNR